MGRLSIILECIFLSFLSIYKQTVFYFYPEERKKDLDKATKSYNFLDEGKSNETIFKVFNMVK